MKDCIFCKIVEGKIPSNKIWENENFLAFLDIYPVGEGHTLLVPKKHFSNLLEVEKNYSEEYMDALKKVGAKLMEKYDSSGFNVVLNNGVNAGQVVDHVHFHLLPRKKGDDKRGLFIG